MDVVAAMAGFAASLLTVAAATATSSGLAISGMPITTPDGLTTVYIDVSADDDGPLRFRRSNDYGIHTAPYRVYKSPHTYRHQLHFSLALFSPYNMISPMSSCLLLPTLSVFLFALADFRHLNLYLYLVSFPHNVFLAAGLFCCHRRHCFPSGLRSTSHP